MDRKISCLLLEEQNIDHFLQTLASSDPVTGGGAVEGLNGAIGAALVSMVCRVTMARQQQPGEGIIQDVLDAAEAIRERLLHSASDDYNAFQALIQAYRMPRGNDEEIEARRQEIACTTREATEVPLQCAQEAREVMQLARQVAEIGLSSVISDVGAGALSAYAALRTSALNVRINTKNMKDHEFRSSAEERIERSLSGCSELLDEINHIVYERL